MRTLQQHFFVLLLALTGLMILSGCGSQPAVGRSSSGDLITDITDKITAQSQKPVDVSNKGWPEGAPADIPVFAATVRNVMAGSGVGSNSRVRIFLEKVTPEQFNQYLAALKQAGYKLQGIVYYHDTSAGLEEAAKKRASNGDYDAVYAEKNPRKLTLSYPGPNGGQVTLDIDGLSAEESLKLNTVAWPKNWVERVPAPDTCKLDQRSISVNTSSGFSLYCTFSDSEQGKLAQIFEAYQQKLLAKGFKSGNLGNSFSNTFTSGDLTVRVAMIANRLTVEGQVKQYVDGQWPKDWLDKVPPPDPCTLDAGSILSYSKTNINIRCANPANDPAQQKKNMDAYVQQLIQKGFKQVQSEPVGDPAHREFTNGSVRVFVHPGPNGEINVGASIIP